MPVRRDCGLVGGTVSEMRRDEGTGDEERRSEYLRGGGGGYCRLALEHDNPVGKIGGHDEVVLNDEGRLLGVEDKPLDEQTVESINEQQ